MNKIFANLHSGSPYWDKEGAAEAGTQPINQGSALTYQSMQSVARFFLLKTNQNEDGRQHQGKDTQPHTDTHFAFRPMERLGKIRHLQFPNRETNEGHGGGGGIGHHTKRKATSP